MDIILNDIDRIYKGIQHLQLEATERNVAILYDTLQVLKDTYAYIQRTEGQKTEDITDGNDYAE